MRRPRVTFANFVSMIALFVALGGTAYSATGSNFILGTSNSADATTDLSSPAVGKVLRLTQTGTSGTALGLLVPTGRPPFTVNSATKVANLNADMLDGKDSSAFQTTDVVARAAGATPQQSGNPPLADYPLNNNSWTQRGGETDFVLAQASVVAPGNCGAQFSDGVFVGIYVDGNQVAGGFTNATGEKTIGPGYLFEPSADTTRTVTAQIYDGCSDQHYTVNSVKVDVFGFR